MIGADSSEGRVSGLSSVIVEKSFLGLHVVLRVGSTYS